MKIRALRLAEVGQFHKPIAVEGFSGGLDVLAGPNELGKSTLFRAIRAVLFTRHTAKGGAITTLASRGAGGSSRIEADIEVQGKSWRISKTFGSGRSADLTDLSTGRVSARGADAEEALSQLIGMSGGDEAAGRFGLLWVEQRRSLYVPIPDFDSERQTAKARGERITLESAIAREIDTVTGGALSRRVADRVAAELGAYINPTRRTPKAGSRYEAATREHARLIGKQGELRAEQVRAVNRLERLNGLIGQQAAEASPERLAELNRASEAVGRSLENAERLTSTFTLAKSAEETAHRTHEQAVERLDRFVKALEEVRASTLEIAKLNDEHVRCTTALGERNVEIAAIEGQIEELGVRIAQVVRESERVRRLSELRGTIDGGEKTLLHIRQLKQEIVRIQAALSANPATPERMRRLDGAVQSAALANERAVSPAAVDLAFALDAAAAARVRINGELAARSGRFGVGEIVTIEIDGIGRFEIIPADAAERLQRRIEAQAAQDQLANIEAELGVGAGEAALALVGERYELGEELTLFKAKLQAVAPHGVDWVERKLKADRQALLELGGTAEASAAAGAEPDATDAEELGRLLRNKEGELRIRLDVEKDARRELEYSLRNIDERRTGLAKQIGACDALLGPEVGRMGERDRLADLKDDAARTWNSALHERTVLEQSVPSREHVDALKEKKTAALSAQRRVESRAQQLAQEIASLEGEVRAAGEAEIEPALAALNDDIAAREAEIAHYKHEIAALELLQRSLAEVASANQTRFLAPVMQRLQPYLEQVFPGAQLALGDDYSLQSFSRGGTGEPVETLSDGTREQLAVLTRLGFGRLIAETGLPAPVILDDALVFSDDERIGRMFGALQSASQHHQVIVFTCREASFAPLGGTRLRIEAWRQ